MGRRSGIMGALNAMAREAARHDTISFNSLRLKEKYPSFKPPKELTEQLQSPNKEDFFVKAPGFFSKLIPGSEKRIFIKSSRTG